MEDNIVKDKKVRDPLVVWGETIIDGHNRWAIIQKHPEIPYTTTAMDFPDKWAAIVWMCQNQLGRRSITEEQRAVLIAQEYDAQKKSTGGDRGTERDDSGKFTAGGETHHLPGKSPKTRAVVAKAHGITENAVKSAVEFSRGLDSADEVAPGFKDSVLTGTIKAPKSVIASLPKMEGPERKKAVEAIRDNDKAAIKAAFNPAVRAMHGAASEPDDTAADGNEYNGDDLKEELLAIVDTFTFNFTAALEVHSVMLKNPATKEKATAALSEAETAIKKIKELLK
ncbi:hypothetical protein [Oscillibacter sp.]|uniref:hypothetical protein n=1 Tax=Oscillibacter sp. TaxID=1945593 RepID=UPI0028A06604|nr:hypothetical protein [Oscillibacter sp.]